MVLCQSNGWHPERTSSATSSTPRKEFCGESCPQDVTSEPLFNNGVLFEKVNSFAPAEFFEKKRLAGRLSRETTYSFYFKKLKRKKMNKIKEKRTRVCQCKNKSSSNCWNSHLKYNCRGQQSHSNCCKKCWKYVGQYWAKFEIDEYMNAVI